MQVSKRYCNLRRLDLHVMVDDGKQETQRLSSQGYRTGKGPLKGTRLSMESTRRVRRVLMVE